jgi:hypothetical protein
LFRNGVLAVQTLAKLVDHLLVGFPRKTGVVLAGHNYLRG